MGRSVAMNKSLCWSSQCLNLWSSYPSLIGLFLPAFFLWQRSLITNHPSPGLWVAIHQISRLNGLQIARKLMGFWRWKIHGDCSDRKNIATSPLQPNRIINFNENDISTLRTAEIIWSNAKPEVWGVFHINGMGYVNFWWSISQTTTFHNIFFS